MRDTVLILHHNDRDGYASAAVIKYCLREGIEPLCDDDPIMSFCAIDYESSIMNIFNNCLAQMRNLVSDFDFDTIYLVDYSISNDRNEKELLELSEKYDLVWIDHHESSIKRIKNNERLAKLSGIRVDGISGAGLCWMYMTTTMDSYHQYNFKDILCLNNVKVTKYEALEILNRYDTPEFIKYVHRYDTWDIDDDVLHFNFGYTKLDLDDMVSMLADPNYCFDILSTSLSRGKIIYEYFMEQNRKVVSDYGVEATYESNGKKYKCLTLNHNNFTSLVFGDTINKYDFVLVYCRKKNLYRCSLYTTKDNVNVGDIAVTHGGGGHKQAAGFVNEKPFWELKGWEII